MTDRSSGRRGENMGGCGILGWLFTALVVSAMSAPRVAYGADYAIDGDHSTVGFKIRHLAISTVHGRFGTFEGTFTYDPKKIEASHVEAKISVASIDTDQKKRDDHLRSADFFNAEKFPEITFKSTAIEKAEGDHFTVRGDLTMHGVTKPVSLDVTALGTATDPWGKERAGFSATTKLNRKDFGLTWSKVLESGALVVGDEVTVVLEIEGIKK